MAFVERALTLEHQAPQQHAELLFLENSRLPLAGVTRMRSVRWAAACEPEGRRFNSRSGRRPGLWVCAQEAMMDLSLPLCHPLFPSLSNQKACPRGRI